MILPPWRLINAKDATKILFELNASPLFYPLRVGTILLCISIKSRASSIFLHTMSAFNKDFAEHLIFNRNQFKGKLPLQHNL